MKKDRTTDTSIADSNSEVSKSRNLWLASLGAYRSTIDELHERYEKASVDTHKLFDELIEKGREIEDNIDGKAGIFLKKSSSRKVTKH